MFDILTQKQLNSIIYVMLHNFHRKTLLDFNQSINDYCTLYFDFDLGDNKKAGDEYILNTIFTVNLTNIKYTGLNYYLKLYYYDLKDGDITDSHNYEIIKTKNVQLSSGVNIISFDEDLVYLQRQYELIVKGG